MIPNYNRWKVLTTFLAAGIALIFNVGSSKQASVQAKVLPAQTLEDRVARIREELESRRVRPSVDPQAPSSELTPSEGENNKEFHSQWYNWGDWYNWSNWSNWRDWVNWGNYW